MEGHSGEEGWWAVVDTKEDGDLTEAVAMTDFDKVCACAWCALLLAGGCGGTRFFFFRFCGGGRRDRQISLD